MQIAVHKGGSGFKMMLKRAPDIMPTPVMVYWPANENAIYILSNVSMLQGCTPTDSIWRSYGYCHSYLLMNPPSGQTMYTFEVERHLPAGVTCDIVGVVEPSRIGREALKMDLYSLRKGEGLACEIETSDGKPLIGRLFRSKAGNIYMLHQNASAAGSEPSDENWRYRSGYEYSWQLLENDLSNDCKPETYRRTGPAVKIYDYDAEIDPLVRAKKDISYALTILRSDVGARVQLTTDTGKLLTGILIKYDRNYYILHDNADAKGDRPPFTYTSKDGLVLPYSWWLDHDLYTTANFKTDSFVLMTHIPMHLDVYDPRDPKVESVTKPREPATYDPVTFEKKECKEEEPELILFKKPTAKVTRCDVQPMQSPQIITKNKK